jgi:hypothetical protein
MVAIAARQTTRIKASMTAYSTAVGPLSSFRNRTSLLIGLGITGLLGNWDKKGHSILEQRASECFWTERLFLKKIPCKWRETDGLELLIVGREDRKAKCEGLGGQEGVSKKRGTIGLPC